MNSYSIVSILTPGFSLDLPGDLKSKDNQVWGIFKRMANADFQDVWRLMLIRTLYHLIFCHLFANIQTRYIVNDVEDEILSHSEKSFNDGKKRTIIVKGGPGTGKSVIAINVLAELTQKGQFVQYVSKK